MDSRIDEFKKYLMNLERSSSTIDSYTRAVRQFFDRNEELNKENMIDFKQWQMGLHKPKTAAPVSDTHLDVYKRQHQSRVPISCRIRQPS